MLSERSYLTVPAPHPRAAFFEFTSCEGCQLQLVNDEDRLLDFLDLLEIVHCRELISESSTVYDIAFVEGSISCREEIEQLQQIRSRATTLVAFGSCACFGGVNQQRNRFSDGEWSGQQLYQDKIIPVHPLPRVFPLQAVVPVDIYIYGCPVHKQDVERIVCDLILGKTVTHPSYPVCLECTAKGLTCLYDLGTLCLGPVTRGGCDAWCPANGAGCQGCRGPAPAANIDQLLQIVQKHAIPEESVLDCLECFGGFDDVVSQLRKHHPQRDFSKVTDNEGV